MDIKTAKEIYDLTGKNPIFEIDDPKKSDPLVWKALIWKYRQSSNPEVKFDEVKDFDIEEMIAAYRHFFPKRINGTTS